MLKYERVEVYLHFCIHVYIVMTWCSDTSTAYLTSFVLSRFRTSTTWLEKLYLSQALGFHLGLCPCFCWRWGWLETFRRKVNWGDGGENVKEKEDREWTNALLKRWKLFLQIKVLMRENRSLHWGGYVTVGGGCADKWGAKCGLDAVFERDMSIWPMHPENDEVLLLIWI